MIEEIIEELPMKKIFITAGIFHIAIIVLAIITL